MKCEKCKKNEATQVKWQWNLCDDPNCVNAALVGPAKEIPCDFCENRSTRTFWGHYTCNGELCNEKARDGRLPENFGNLALTTFGKNDTRRASSYSSHYTPAQERKWADVCDSLGFNQDGTQKT